MNENALFSVSLERAKRVGVPNAAKDLGIVSAVSIMRKQKTGKQVTLSAVKTSAGCICPTETGGYIRRTIPGQ